jgi:transcriptional regulator with XRE-family HTH domain
MVHLGNNIAKLRGFRRLPQKDVAIQLDLSQQEYSKIENKAQIDDDLLERIAAIIDFPSEIIKELDSNVTVQSYNQQGGSSGSITTSTFNQYNADKIADLYEKLLKEKDEVIKSKEQVIENKDTVIEMYKQQQKAS